MPLNIIRPGSQFPDDRREELALYLNEQWLRAKRGRQDQIDSKYANWQKAYSGVPLEEIRTVPFYKSSNFVVKLIRMFLDTFMARTLNIIFATKPLCVSDGLPRDLREAWELYLNRKACYEWSYYNLVKTLCMQGNKNGTAVIKTPWVEKQSWAMSLVNGLPKEEQITEFAGPASEVIPFDDFFIYPITAPTLCKAEIIFHRLRYIKEQAERLQAKGSWQIPKEIDLATFCKHPADVQRNEEQVDAGVVDPYLLELEGIECHLNWPITNDSSKLYNVVAVFQPDMKKVVDLYYNPYPQNLSIFNDYRPFPRDDIFYGESMSELLGQSQEEASAIHNDRRNNSILANAVCFKRRSGSLVPNPSTNWYPGKVWDLEDMTDLEVFDVGRDYSDMIPQEDYTFSLAEKLSGIGEIMQGAAQGTMAQRGIYNTTGTLSVMAEGNQRQDTNIRDVRQVIALTLKRAARLQATFGADDPFIKTLPQEAQQQVNQAMQIFASDQYRYVELEVKSSSAGSNTEVRKANIMLMAQTLGQYGQTAVQISSQLANNQLNPVMKEVMSEFVTMQRWIAARLLKELDEWDATEILPDVTAALAAGQPPNQPGGAPGPQGQGAPGAASVQPGGAGGTLPPVQRAQLQTLASLPGPNGAASMPGGLAQ